MRTSGTTIGKDHIRCARSVPFLGLQRGLNNLKKGGGKRVPSHHLASKGGEISDWGKNKKRW